MLSSCIRLLLLSLMIALISSSALSQTSFRRGEHECLARTPQDKIFLDAVKTGDHISVKRLLRQGINPDTKDDCAIFAVTHAVVNGHIENLKLLIAAGADLNVIDGFYAKPPLLWAIKESSRREEKYNAYLSVKSLVDAGADVNLKGRADEAALSLAVNAGLKEIVELMIAAGAEVNARDNWGRTAYSYAAESGNRKIKSLLLAAGADTNVDVEDYRERYGRDALIVAATDGRTDVLEALLASGADANYANEAGVTALMGVVNESSLDALLAAGADVNRKDGAGFTALVWAAFFGRVEQVRKLIAAGANVNVVIYDGKTALELAKPEVKELLIAAGAKR